MLIVALVGRFPIEISNISRLGGRPDISHAGGKDRISSEPIVEMFVPEEIPSAGLVGSIYQR